MHTKTRSIACGRWRLTGVLEIQEANQSFRTRCCRIFNQDRWCSRTGDRTSSRERRHDGWDPANIKPDRCRHAHGDHLWSFSQSRSSPVPVRPARCAFHHCQPATVESRARKVRHQTRKSNSRAGAIDLRGSTTRRGRAMRWGNVGHVLFLFDQIVVPFYFVSVL